MTQAFRNYAQEVREGKFPVDAEHTYKMKDEEVLALAKRLNPQK